MEIDWRCGRREGCRERRIDRRSDQDQRLRHRLHRQHGGNLMLLRTDTDEEDTDFTDEFPKDKTTVTYQFSGMYGETPYEITDANTNQSQTYQVNGSPFMLAKHMPHYVDAVGQYLIQDVEMTIGGARVALLNSMYMYIHEELFGMPGRRQQDAIGKTGELYDPETDDDAGTDELERKSMGARRLYVQLPFWWTGGKMERALLKTIALQLHKIEFKITTRRLSDCIAYASFSTERLPKASANLEHCSNEFQMKKTMKRL